MSDVVFTNRQRSSSMAEEEQKLEKMAAAFTTILECLGEDPQRQVIWILFIHCFV